MKQDPSDRNKIIDGNGNLVFICVSGFPCDADELVKVWGSFEDLENTVSDIEDALEDAQMALSKAVSSIDDLKN